MSTQQSAADAALEALIAQYGSHNLFVLQAVCIEATRLFSAPPLEILKLLAKATPEELAAATDVAKGLHLVGVLVLRSIDADLTEASKVVPPTEVDLTAAPQFCEAVLLKNAELETQALLARTMGGSGDPRTLH